MKGFYLFFAFLVAGAAAAVMYLKTPPPATELVSPNLRVISYDALRPPEQSLKGQVTSLSGDVFWRSRAATATAKIVLPQPIQQGESIKTGVDGSADIIFPFLVSMTVHPKTELEFVQTLPLNVVVAQKSGTARFYDKSSSIPLSVRALHLLIDQSAGDLLVSVDPRQRLVNLDIGEGEATAAFNNTQNISQVIKLRAGRSYTFDDRLRKF